MAKVTSSGVKIPNSLILKYTEVNGLSLGAGDTYQLNLPTGCSIIEVLLESSGTDTGSGGNFVYKGGGITYINNTANTSSSEYKGIYVTCYSDGLVSISTYMHCGAKVKGFRMWYIDNK